MEYTYYIVYHKMVKNTIMETVYETIDTVHDLDFLEGLRAWIKEKSADENGVKIVPVSWKRLQK